MESRPVAHGKNKGPAKLRRRCRRRTIRCNETAPWPRTRLRQCAKGYVDFRGCWETRNASVADRYSRVSYSGIPETDLPNKAVQRGTRMLRRARNTIPRTISVLRPNQHASLRSPRGGSPSTLRDKLSTLQGKLQSGIGTSRLDLYQARIEANTRLRSRSH